MWRVVLDTNIVISGLLWSGTPHEVMKRAFERKFMPFATEAMLDELSEVLAREKFKTRLTSRNQSVADMVSQYAKTVQIVDAESLETQVSEDADDDVFIACAIKAKANYIVSGDPHLLKLKHYETISIIDARSFLDKFDTDA